MVGLVVYKIGDFANIVNISVRTLRYYDEIGLLKPEIVDRYTNYRYYTEDNVVEAQFITLLKGVGFTLQEIIDYKNFLNDYDDNDDGTNQFLLKKQEQISKQMEELQEMRKNVTVRLFKAALQEHLKILAGIRRNCQDRRGILNNS